MKVDTPYLIAGAVGILAILGGLAFWIWGGSSTETPTAVASGDCVPKETYEVSANDYTLGKPDAPITIIEYASMTCIHCARFSRDVLPSLKEHYVDKGYVRYVFREFPLDQVALTASVIGRCLQKDAYIPYVEMMYHDLETWAQPGTDLRASIKEMARRAGMSGDDFEKCLSTEEDAKKIVEAQAKANKDYCVSGTPTFLMNGKKLAGGEIAWSELDEKLRAELKAKGVTPPPAAATAPAEGTPAEGAAPAPAEGAAAPAEGAPAAPAEGTAPAPASGAATPPAATPPATTPPATTPAPAAGTPNP